MVRITKDKRHDILKDGICIGQIYLARAESRKLRKGAIHQVIDIVLDNHKFKIRYLVLVGI